MARTLINKVLEQINPLEDHKRTNFEEIFFTDIKSLEESERKKLSKDRAMFFLSCLKPFIRGEIVGGFIGAGVGYLTGDDVAMYTGSGAKYGAMIDALQYTMRGAYHFLKAENSANKKEGKVEEKSEEGSPSGQIYILEPKEKKEEEIPLGNKKILKDYTETEEKERLKEEREREERERLRELRREREEEEQMKYIKNNLRDYIK